MAKKIILIIVGLFALLSGLAVTAGGSALLALGGRTGTIHSGYHAVTTQTAAFVSDPAQIRDSSNVDIKAGTATLQIDGRNSLKPLFVGVGPSDQVAAYLANSPYEVVTKIDFSPFALTTSQNPGASQPAVPTDQSFWVAQATGQSPQLSWDIANGSYRVVVMNADGSPDVGLDARVGLRVPALFTGALAATIGGALVALLGLALLIWGIAARRKRGAVATRYPGGYPTPQSGPYPPGSAPFDPYPPGSGSYAPGSYPPGSNMTGPYVPAGAPPANGFPANGGIPPHGAPPFVGSMPSNDAVAPASSPPAVSPPAYHPTEPGTTYQPSAGATYPRAELGNGYPVPGSATPTSGPAHAAPSSGGPTPNDA